MANVDSNTKLKSTAFEKFRKTGDLTGSLSPNPPVPVASVAQDEDPIGRAIASAKRYGITLDPGTLNILAAGSAFQGPKTPGFSEPGGEKEKLDYWTQKQKEQADYRQQLGEQSTKKALMYSTIAKLPEQMANAFSPYGGQTGALMAYEGMSRIPEMYRNTLASVPQMNISIPGYSAQQPRYFS